MKQPTQGVVWEVMAHPAAPGTNSCIQNGSHSSKLLKSPLFSQGIFSGVGRVVLARPGGVLDGSTEVGPS